MLSITAGGFEFTARLEEGDAPETVAAFRRLLPLESPPVDGIKSYIKSEQDKWGSLVRSLGLEGSQ